MPRWSCMHWTWTVWSSRIWPGGDKNLQNSLAKRLSRVVQLWFRMRYWTRMSFWVGYCYNSRLASWKCLPTCIWSRGWRVWRDSLTRLWCWVRVSWESIWRPWIFIGHMLITSSKIWRFQRFCDDSFWKLEWERSPTILVWLWRDTKTLRNYTTWWKKSLIDICDPSMGSKSDWWKWGWTFDRWHASLYYRIVSHRATSRNKNSQLIIPIEIW